MSEEASRSSGVFLPYPLLGILMTLILALGGGIIGLYSQVSALSTTILMRDADHRREQQQAWDKIQQLEVYIHNDREKLAELKAKIDRQNSN